MNMNTSNVLTEDKATLYNNDVFADIKPSTRTNTVDTDEAEMLASISAKLGASAPVINTAVEYNEDLMPSQSTMNYTFHRQYEANSSVAAKMSVDTKTKVAIASYVAVVLVLILGITLCSLAVTSAFASISTLNGDLALANESLATLDGALLASQDYQTLLNRANELGFVSITGDNSFSYDVLQTRPPQNIVVNSNWFDSLCDWFSGVFGG